MKEEQIKEYLKGRTIESADLYITEAELGCDSRICLESITFTDGSVMELWGQADDCYIGNIKKPDGDWINV